ncbi:MAG: transglutaminase family protein [Planctomycetaceae bacterium]|nr:transglutaminase family protein [Planctomycetaceae bacterium]
MIYKVTHTTTYSYSETVPVCHNEVHLTPREHPYQACSYNRLLIRPHPVTSGKRVDYFGNPVSFFTVQEGHHKLVVTAVSKVRLSEPPDHRPAITPPWEKIRAALPGFRHPQGLDAYQYVFDSPHVACSAELAGYAHASFTPGRPILEAAIDLNQRIHRDFEYDPQATSVHTPLSEVLAHRRGVCQDFAHLAIGCLRSLGLAARYVSGYLRTVPPPGKPRLVGADASHAWLSIFCPESGWVDLDPTNNSVPSLDYITLAWGRDYSDVCPIKGVFVGGGNHGMSVSVDVVPLS